MTIGAIVVPLVALGLCAAGMWFAWRLVRAAAREGELESGERGGEAPPARPKPPLGAAQQIGAVAAAVGVCLWLPSLVNVQALWPLTAGGAVASLLGLGLLLAGRARRRSGSAGSTSLGS